MTTTVAALLLKWYDKNQRVLPWRALPGTQQNPYFVWLSEIMLQQTTVPTVHSYFEKFITRWPTVESLAAAALDEILFHWQGLGYYSRAHNLHKCAQVIAWDQGGQFPKTLEGLMALPGIGPYTAAAIASIAFNQPQPVIDGNVERLMARLYDLHIDKARLKKPVREHLLAYDLSHRPGDLAQAMMDFAGQVCTPSKPKCAICPLTNHCKALKAGTVGQLPVRSIKAKPTRYCYFFWLDLPLNYLILYKRPNTGLLPGLMCLPTSDWTPHKAPDLSQAAIQLNIPLAQAEVQEPIVRHTFTHFHLEAQVVRVPATASILSPLSMGAPPLKIHKQELENQALPTLMKKTLKSIGLL